MFIGFALLTALGLALVINFGAGQFPGLSDDQFGQLLFLTLVLIVVASGIFGRRIRLLQIASGVTIWSSMLLILVAGYTYREEIATFSGRVLAALSPGMAVVDQNEGTAVFQKGFGNTFKMDTRVNGAHVRMIFDTGASAVVLTSSDARAAGIDISGLRFNIEVQTANGLGKAAGITLESIQVGGITRENIRAFVAEKGALKTSLLGMTFLQTLKNYTVSRDYLELNG